MAARRTATKAAAKPPVETDEDAFEELDEIEEAEEPTDDAPARKARKSTGGAAAAKDTGYGSVWLAEHVSDTTGTDIDSRGIRMYLRRLARDEEGPLARAVGEDRGRYTFKGPNDPVVKAIVRMVKEGATKTRAKAEATTEATPTKRTRKAAAKPVEEPVEEVEETPRRRTRATKAAAPAKATPARTRRRSAAAAE